MATQTKTAGSGAKKANPVFSVIKSALIALICSIVLIAAAALLLQKQALGISSIKVINPVIKALSALIAALIGVRSFEKRSWLYGALSGVVYVLLSFVVFSLLTNDFSFGAGTLIDILMCGCAGMTGGILHGLSK